MGAIRTNEASLPRSRARRALACASAAFALLLALPCAALDAGFAVPPERLTPDYWIARDAAAREPVLDRDAIAALNARLQARDASVNDLAALPDKLERARVHGWVEAMSKLPDGTLYDAEGNALRERARSRFVRDAAIDRIPASTPVRWGLVVRRAPLRTFPTRVRVFNARGNTDIDRFQENALFPGTPVAVVHESRDGDWWFVVSPLYEAWIEKQHVALGARDTVLAYPKREPHIVVTGATVRTVYTPEAPAVSSLQLDMGVRLPRLADWPADRAVNGQHPHAHHVVELPVRGADGGLAFAPALVPRTADVATDYLALDRASLLRQAFKFLGERYGWGHDYGARDCSGFVSEVYRSFGVMLPRNTKDQAVSPAYERIAFDAAATREERLATLRSLAPGDLVYIPGHVMMVIGHDDGGPWVIHDTTGIGLERDGRYVRIPLNGVSVTPLVPLQAGEGTPTIDRITAIQRIRHADTDTTP